jgi:hypothetical protein
MKELARSYLTITRDLTRVTSLSPDRLTKLAVCFLGKCIAPLFEVAVFAHSSKSF